MEEIEPLDTKPDEKKLDFTILYDYLPKISAYQVLIVILLGHCNILGGSIQLAQIILQVAPDEFNCVQYKTNDTSVCAPCSEYNYSFILFDETVNSEFDLVCDDAYKSSLVSTLSLAALFFGAIGLGVISDNLGRRNALMIASGLFLICLKYA